MGILCLYNKYDVTSGGDSAPKAEILEPGLITMIMQTIMPCGSQLVYRIRDTDSDEDLWHIHTPEACCHIVLPGPVLPPLPVRGVLHLPHLQGGLQGIRGHHHRDGQDSPPSSSPPPAPSLWTSPPSPAHAPWPASTPSCALPCSLMPPSLALAPSALEPSGLSTAFARPLRPLQRPWSWSGQA